MPEKRALWTPVEAREEPMCQKPIKGGVEGQADVNAGNGESEEQEYVWLLAGTFRVDETERRRR